MSTATNLKVPPFFGQHKIQILDLGEYRKDPTMITAIFHGEDHTIGNALKHIICKMPNVEFCGYNVPHPLEDKILVRVQTKNGVPAGDLLIQALDDLDTIFGTIGDKFSRSYAEFKTRQLTAHVRQEVNDE